jgi:hypothetical protein
MVRGWRVHWLLLALITSCAYAGGGPLGIDHEWTYDNSGIWSTHYETAVEYGALAFEVGGALWLGSENDFGHTLWQSIDATALGEISAEILKYGFGRARPNQGDNPDKWFQGTSYDSFPSGQVTLQASFVTPIIVHYAHEDPWIWALEALPLYDGLARLKHQDHWQSDVIAGWALGTATGYWASRREMPFSVQILPRGLTIGIWRSY